ncbi:unnamed protein product [Amoebophrya sp. A120]|nr:unnamed protein product [Amoebophrya sp. A120]|eukprot:GSA120T00006411001.1
MGLLSSFLTCFRCVFFCGRKRIAASDEGGDQKDLDENEDAALASDHTSSDDLSDSTETSTSRGKVHSGDESTSDEEHVVAKIPQRIVNKKFEVALDLDQRRIIQAFLKARKNHLRKLMLEAKKKDSRSEEDVLASLRRSYDKETKKMLRKIEPLTQDQRHWAGQDITVTTRRDFYVYYPAKGSVRIGKFKYRIGSPVQLFLADDGKAGTATNPRNFHRGRRGTWVAGVVTAFAPPPEAPSVEIRTLRNSVPAVLGRETEYFLLNNFEATKCLRPFVFRQPPMQLHETKNSLHPHRQKGMRVRKSGRSKETHLSARVGSQFSAFLSSTASSFLSGGSSNKHQARQLQTTAKRETTASSGFLPEDYQHASSIDQEDIMNATGEQDRGTYDGATATGMLRTTGFRTTTTSTHHPVHDYSPRHTYHAGPRESKLPQWAVELRRPLSLVRDPEETAFYVDPEKDPILAAFEAQMGTAKKKWDAEPERPASAYDTDFVQKKERLSSAVFENADLHSVRTSPQRRCAVEVELARAQEGEKKKPHSEQKKISEIQVVDKSVVSVLPVASLRDIASLSSSPSPKRGGAASNAAESANTTERGHGFFPSRIYSYDIHRPAGVWLRDSQKSKSGQNPRFIS